ncbi:MAG: hypothetical protein QNJ22_22385 [Desulfosarcinaceae bacterium]|nr:hypothetical protein [Desulfosarcinaceae bacterium]
MEFICKSKNCPYEGPGPYVLSLPEEIPLDRNNVATMFCPHCEQELVEKTPAEKSPA